MKPIYNVAAFAPGIPEAWVHPTNLWIVNRNAGYYPIPFNDNVTGAEYCLIRWLNKVVN